MKAQDELVRSVKRTFIIFVQKIKKKSRLMGIDPGKKRVGIAISDENKIVATPYKTLIRNNYTELLSGIKKIIVEIKFKKNNC